MSEFTHQRLSIHHQGRYKRQVDAATPMTADSRNDGVSFRSDGAARGKLPASSSRCRKIDHSIVSDGHHRPCITKRPFNTTVSVCSRYSRVVNIPYKGLQCFNLFQNALKAVEASGIHDCSQPSNISQAKAFLRLLR